MTRWGRVRRVDDAQVGPRVGAHKGTLVEDRPLRLVRADMGLRVEGLWLPNGGALRLQIREVGRTTVRLVYGHLALWCARRCWARLAHRALRCFVPERLQQLSYISRGPDLLG
jgi:hypothetical protein